MSKRKKSRKKLQTEQSPNFWGNPTFSGTGNYGVGGHKQMAHLGPNPATKQISDQEQEELQANLDRQETSVVGKGYRGTSITPQVPHWDGRNGSVETVAEEVEEQVSQHNSVNRMRDLPGFPRHNTLVSPKSHVPANDHSKNVDPVSGKKAEYLGPTLNGKEMIEYPENLVHETLEEMLGHPKASKDPSRQGWNNQRINSLALRKNHINPDNEPPEMWHPLFKNPSGEHNPVIVRDAEENMNSSANNKDKPSSTPAWSMGSIGFPKRFVPDDYEQANEEYDEIIKDTIGTRRLQLPMEEEVDPRGQENGSRDSVKAVYGSKVPDGMGGAKAFEKSRQKVLRNLVETLVAEVLQEMLEEQGTMAPQRRARRMPGVQGPSSEQLSFDALRDLLKKKPESLSNQEVSGIIDYVSARPDLKQEFKTMPEQEIQALETVLDKNIPNEKMGPFYNKIEIARAEKHLSTQAQQSSAKPSQGKTPPPSPQQKQKATLGSGPAQKISLPKQPLSQQFTNAVKQRYGQIVNAQGLTKQQKEKLVQQLGQIQFEPESSEASKLKRIDDLVKVGVGTRVDFGGEPAQQGSKPVKNPGQAPQVPQQTGGFIGTAKRFLGLNEMLEFLLEEEHPAQKISLSDLVVNRQSLLDAYDDVFLRKAPSRSRGPLEVMPIDDEPGKYQLIDGHHRLVEFLIQQNHRNANGMIEVVVNDSDAVKSYYAVPPTGKRWQFLPGKKYGNLESMMDRKLIARDLQSYLKMKAGKKGEEEI